MRIDDHRMCMKDNQKKVLILSFGTTMAMVPRERYETSQDFAGLELLLANQLTCCRKKAIEKCPFIANIASQLREERKG
jgi:hypothetical protein